MRLYKILSIINFIKQFEHECEMGEKNCCSSFDSIANNSIPFQEGNYAEILVEKKHSKPTIVWTRDRSDSHTKNNKIKYRILKLKLHVEKFPFFLKRIFLFVLFK